MREQIERARVSRESESERAERAEVREAQERMREKGFGGVREKRRGESEKRGCVGGKRGKKVGSSPMNCFRRQKIKFRR